MHLFKYIYNCKKKKQPFLSRISLSKSAVGIFELYPSIKRLLIFTIPVFCCTIKLKYENI